MGDQGIERKQAAILVLFCHPDPARSRFNRMMIKQIADLDGVNIRDLYALYPDFDVDVAMPSGGSGSREQ